MLEVDVKCRLGGGKPSGTSPDAGNAGFAIDAAFAAGPGVTALFGRSGAGKTSIVNMIAGLLPPQAGRIAVNGRVLYDGDRRISLPTHKRRVGYVFQDGRLFPHLTVRQNLAYGRWYGRWFKRTPAPGATLGHIVDLLDIEPLLGRLPGSLSGGEKQRVAIGRALLSDPGLLLMDEPLASLDDGRKQDIIPYIERLADETGLAILYVSHDLGEVSRLADTVVLISDGRVRAHGPTEEIMARTDLFPLTGRFEAGAVISCVAGAVDEKSGLLHLASEAGPLVVPAMPVEPGSHLRIRIRARDVIIATGKPRGLSALNIVPVTIVEMRLDPPFADLKLDAGGAALLARITDHSVRTLKLEPGKRAFAIIKSTAFDHRSLGVPKTGGV